MSLNCISNENSEFTNYAYRNKNSYLVFWRISMKTRITEDSDVTISSARTGILPTSRHTATKQLTWLNAINVSFPKNARTLASFILLRHERLPQLHILSKFTKQEKLHIEQTSHFGRIPKGERKLNLGSHQGIMDAMKKAMNFYQHRRENTSKYCNVRNRSVII